MLIACCTGVIATSAHGQGVIATVAGNGTHGYSGDGGPATSAALSGPYRMAVDAEGNLYIADNGNQRIRKVTPEGIISTAAGTGVQDFTGDGGPATSAALNFPAGVAFDAVGNWYIADYYRVRKVNPDGIITTVAGGGLAIPGDGGPATDAYLNPQDVAVDAFGNIFIAEPLDIRKVSPSGTISTVAGTGQFGFSGDGGPATSALFSSISQIAADASGNLYIADTFNDRIRKMTPEGIISTYAGGGTLAGTLADGGPATSAALRGPRGVAVDTAGNLYIADQLNYLIRKVSPAGIISTVAGGGDSTDDGIPPTDAMINPHFLAVDDAGNLYLNDSVAVVRKVTFGSSPPPPPAQISLLPASRSFSGFVGGGTERQVLEVSGGGRTVNWTATATVLNGAGWLVVTPPNGTATANVPSTVTVDVDFSAFSEAGVYQAEILIEDTGGSGSVRVPVAVTVSPAGSRLLLSRAAVVFQGAEGGSTPPSQRLAVFNAGQGNLNWTIPADLAPWLTVSPLAGTVSAGARQAATVSVNPAGLSAGVYQVLADVVAEGAVNPLQQSAITLEIAPSGTPASAALAPGGMLFLVPAGSASPAVETITVSNTGGGSLTFDWQATTTAGGNWLSVSPMSGDTTAGPAAAQVAANPSGLTAGFYRGKLTGTFSASGTREVDVLLVVTPQGAGPQRALPRAEQCAGGEMEVVVTSLGTGSVAPLTFPQALIAEVVNSCGEGVNDATVVANVEGSTIALASLGDGTYSGTWTPEQEAAEVAISIVALHPNYGRVDRSITVTTAAAAGGVSLPVLFEDGVVEGAAFTSRRPLAPGGIISLFGSHFATGDASSTGLPLKTSLGGVSVQIGGKDTPLYFAGQGQVNAQVPYGTQPGRQVSVAVKVNGRVATPQKFPVAKAQPGIFLAGEGGAILDAQSHLVNAANPAQRGTVLQIFATGLGETDPPGQTGEGALSFSQVLEPVTVKIGGVEAPVQYQGLAPGYVGLYQVNVQLPTTVTPGDAVEVVIEQNGIRSNPDRPATIPVQ